MDTAEIVKAIELKTKELEDLKKRLPSYKDRKCGKFEHNDPASMWVRIEEMEEEVEALKEKLKEVNNLRVRSP